MEKVSVQALTVDLPLSKMGISISPVHSVSKIQPIVGVNIEAQFITIFHPAVAGQTVSALLHRMIQSSVQGISSVTK
jgi:hypothetical protein